MLDTSSREDNPLYKGHNQIMDIQCPKLDFSLTFEPSKSECVSVG